MEEKNENNNRVIQGWNTDWVFGEKLYVKIFHRIGVYYIVQL